MGSFLAPVAGAVIGGLFQQDAADTAAGAQQASDAARLAEEKRVREQLRTDTEAQRAVADKAFADYQAGLLSYADAQKIAADAMQGVQQSVGQSQLADVAKTQQLAEFKPYGITSGTGSTFFNRDTGQAGFNLSPELQQYQQSLFGGAGQAAANIATSPEQAAQQYMQQQQGLLAPQRQAEDIALRSQQLQQGRIGLGISSEAAGAGTGGFVNPEQFSQDRARALADAQIAANATQAGQQQSMNQLNLASGLFSAGQAPEQQGMANLATGVNLGQQFAAGGLNQANLYNQGMGNYYNSLINAQATAGEGMLATPAAQQAGAQEAYQRQQTYLGALQGNTLPYQAMTTPQAIVPGSAYAMAGLGSGLMNAGMQGIQNAFKTPTTTPTSPYANMYSGYNMQYE